jgi:hypothetical protein
MHNQLQNSVIIRRPLQWYRSCHAPGCRITKGLIETLGGGQCQCQGPWNPCGPVPVLLPLPRWPHEDLFERTIVLAASSSTMWATDISPASQPEFYFQLQRFAHISNGRNWKPTKRKKKALCPTERTVQIILHLATMFQIIWDNSQKKKYAFSKKMQLMGSIGTA